MKKFFCIDKNPDFKITILNWISKKRRCSIEQLIKEMNVIYQTEIFQHEVDLGIAIKMVIGKLLDKKMIELYNENNEKYTFPLNPKEHNKLIANEKGILEISYSPVMFQFVLRTKLGKNGVDIGKDYLNRYK